MRLTRRGIAVLAGAVCCYAFGELAGYPLFRAIAGIAAGAVVASLAVALWRPKVEIRRSVHPERIERGKPALATLVVTNDGTRPHRGFAANDRLGDEGHQVQVRPLQPGTAATYHYELPTHRRGKLPVGPLVLNRFDPFGLARGDRTVGGVAHLWAYPRLHAVRAAGAGFPRHHYDGPVTDPPLRGSWDLRAVREYMLGDEVRHLHWKASARTGKLMVREYADPAQLRFTAVLDTRPESMDPEVFEEAVEVAASLLYSSALAGQHCRLLTPTGVNTAVDSGLGVARVLLDELCLVAQDAPNGEPLVPLKRPRPGGTLAVITGARTDLGAASRWRPDYVIRLGAGGEATAGELVAPDAAGFVRLWNGVGVA
ncbi:DUF58 domain-containing protein [Amycolatopsis acidicola]|uniref:DUF58 domain-containing protein n=1 Tax=Amycolatopsis acidicola TaxID=2596893 RepID=A0A5N0UX95_9PSEU|nr:DUF58 domain-containing protein [Amycolatopsis acidicola]KAA9155797.1 DUF58 domain-containing protein [Amycolatopsis acidicola]